MICLIELHLYPSLGLKKSLCQRFIGKETFCLYIPYLSKRKTSSLFFPYTINRNTLSELELNKLYQHNSNSKIEILQHSLTREFSIINNRNKKSGKKEKNSKLNYDFFPVQSFLSLVI